MFFELYFQRMSPKLLALNLKSSRSKYQQESVELMPIFVAKLLKEFMLLFEPIILLSTLNNPHAQKWLPAIKRIFNFKSSHFKVKNPATLEDVKKFVDMEMSKELLLAGVNSQATPPNSQVAPPNPKNNIVENFLLKNDEK